MRQVLYLNHHCIETEIKRLYNRAVSAYFKERNESVRKTLETEIDFFHHALNTLDFGRLRSTYPALSGHSNAHINLSADENGWMITIDGESFYADQY